MTEQPAGRRRGFELNQTAQVKIGNFNVQICLPQTTLTLLLEVFGKCSGVFIVQGRCGCKLATGQFNVPTLPLCGSIIMRGHMD